MLSVEDGSPCPALNTRSSNPRGYRYARNTLEYSTFQHLISAAFVLGLVEGDLAWFGGPGHLLVGRRLR